MREKYNPDSVFKKFNEETTHFDSAIAEETALVEFKENTFIQKILDEIKQLFKKN